MVVHNKTSSHVAMLATFEEPSSVHMAKETCMAAAMTPLDVSQGDASVEPAVDERAAHTAMLCAITDSELQEVAFGKHGDLSPNDTTVSHFAMFANADDTMSSACMAGSLTRHDAGIHGPLVTMPADDHISNTAMRCADWDKSFPCMPAILKAEDPWAQ